jgi:Flp pilus assembly protein TadB
MSDDEPSRWAPGPDGGLARWDMDRVRDAGPSRNDADTVAAAAVVLALCLAVVAWRATFAGASWWGIALCVVLGLGVGLIVVDNLRRRRGQAAEEAVLDTGTGAHAHMEAGPQDPMSSDVEDERDGRG